MTFVNYISVGHRGTGRTRSLINAVHDALAAGKRPLVLVADVPRANSFWDEYVRTDVPMAARSYTNKFRRVDVNTLSELSKAKGKQYDCLFVDDVQDVLLGILSQSVLSVGPGFLFGMSVQTSYSSLFENLSSSAYDRKWPADPDPTIIWWTGDLGSYAVVVKVLQDQPEDRQLQWLKGKHDALIIMPADKPVEDCLEDGDFYRVPVDHGFSISEDGITVHPKRVSPARKAMSASLEADHKAFLDKALDAATDPGNYSPDVAKFARLVRNELHKRRLN